MNIIKALLFGVVCLVSLSCTGQQFNVFSDFPGGNIRVEKINQDTVWIRPDLRDTNGEWFYWYFAVNRAIGKTLTFVLTKPNCLTSKGPAISTDGGKYWSWINPDHSWDSSFSYTFKTNSEVRFSMGMPYTQKHFQQFIGTYLKSEFVTIDTLATTKAGRSVERVILKSKSGTVKYKVLITTRHHACEMMGNYEMEGIISEILKDEWLKNNIEFCLIPFMDKDGVENGDQGKNRAPHDHNRDYQEPALYPEVAALMRFGAANSQRVTAFLDLHCPYIRGEWNDRVYIVGAEEPRVWEQQQAFARVLEQVQEGALGFRSRDCLAFGTAWNTGGNFTQGRSSTAWARAAFPRAQLVTTFEIAYADALGHEVNADSARSFGRDLARALADYLVP